MFNNLDICCQRNIAINAIFEFFGLGGVMIITVENLRALCQSILMDRGLDAG